MLPELVLGHLIQTLPHGGNYYAHSPLWFRDLGAKLAIDRLGPDGESSDLASQAYYLMQMYSSAAHYSDRVWCPPLTPRGHLSLGLLPS